jgi:hypothetical protein
MPEDLRQALRDENRERAFADLHTEIADYLERSERAIGNMQVTLRESQESRARTEASVRDNDAEARGIRKRLMAL